MWLRRALACLGGQGEALPLPASGARERQEGCRWGQATTHNGVRPHYPDELMGGTQGLRISLLTHEPPETIRGEAPQLKDYGWPHKPSPIRGEETPAFLLLYYYS